jgi:peptidoglycan/LPS O-acetylase OafA/YrhL
MHTPKQTSAASAYRPDIDGLRAVAVLLVVFNHLRIRFNGGYVGVDVFFVISGYLIGAHILSEMGRGEFSLVNFYERRIRRIVPALFVMLLGASLLACRYLLPTETVPFAGSLLAAIVSVSNILFAHQAGYFDAPSLSKPLLHTWSLGVEEQFYIFFPLLLLAIRRWFPRRLKIVLWTVAIASFVLSVIWVQRVNSTTAFFLAPWRAWELLLGAIASQSYLPRIKGPVARNVASLAGISLILWPAVSYSAATSFPGMAALPPCLGATLLILGGQDGPSLVGSVLSWRPVVFVGLISYSLYLWHWPLLTFFNASLVEHGHLPIGVGQKTAKMTLLAVSLLLATLSWRFVETPFRKGSLRLPRRPLFIASAAAAGLLAAVAIGMTATHGLPQRFTPDVVQADAVSLQEMNWRHGQCFLSDDNTFADFSPQVCLRDDGTRKQYLLFGDSHAADKYDALAKTFPELNISQATVHSCSPLLQQLENPYADATCKKMSTFIYGDYLLHHHVDGVILSARWFQPDLPWLEQTIAWFKQHNIRLILIGPNPEFAHSLPQLVAIGMRDGRPRSYFDAYRVDSTYKLDRDLAQRARTQWKVPYVSVYADLCASQVEMEAKSQPETSAGCPVYTAQGVPLLSDGDHLSHEGSLALAKAIRSSGQLP